MFYQGLDLKKRELEKFGKFHTLAPNRILGFTNLVLSIYYLSATAPNLSYSNHISYLSIYKKSDKP